MGLNQRNNACLLSTLPFRHTILSPMKTPASESPQCPYSSPGDNEPTLDLPIEKRWEARELYPRLSLREESPADLETEARLAWRNSIRCIGRSRWQSLSVIDARSVASADELFDALRTHLERATTSCAAKSIMTIFSKFDPAEPETRIWNRQLISYAGYRAKDNSILGDPMNCKLTAIALGLGWKPPSTRTAFDRLPLIIQFRGKLYLRSLPSAPTDEITIRHPDFPKIEALGLRWYGVPIVADMLFATKGALYPAAPFSGHYVSTEIAARNLADKNRYNRLPQIAEAIGLEPTKRVPLWIDRALAVINEAVLFSFDQAGYKMTDHHTVSSEFDHFCQKEALKGRTVNGDWAWLVPPMSGATSPTFSKSFNSKVVLPNFLYQKAAWVEGLGSTPQAHQ